MVHLATEAASAPIGQAAAQNASPLVWLVVKRWAGGLVEYHSAYLSEEEARGAASRLISSTYMINLETVPLGMPPCEEVTG